MKFSKLLFTTALFVAVRAQDDPTTTDTTTTSTTDDGGALVTLAPEVCPTAGLESCYNILEILQPTVYVILTVTDSVPASLAAEETIASGDPILTQTDNIATGTDDAVDPPRTASIRIHYTESDGTTCNDAETISTLTTSDAECTQFTAPFFTPPPATTKTRVFIKGREDSEVGKEGPSGGGNSDPAPGGTTDTNLPVNTGGADTTTPPPDYTTGTTEDGAEPTENTGTTDTYPAGGASDTTTGTYDSASDEPSSDSPSYQPTDSNSISTTTDSPTTLLTSSQGGSSSGDNTDEQGKGELTSYTTLAEVTNGVTNYVTKPIATLTSAKTSATSSPGPLTGAGSIHTMIVGQVLLGAAGLGVILGL